MKVKSYTAIYRAGKAEPPWYLRLLFWFFPTKITTDDGTWVAYKEFRSVLYIQLIFKVITPNIPELPDGRFN